MLERNGTAYATVWDDKGESRISLPKEAVISYTKEIESGEMPVVYDGDSAVINVGEKAYIRSSLSIADLTMALANAEIV